MRNSAALYGVQFCRKVIPLITIPYLAHILGVVGWGTVAFVLSLGELIALFIEFGFNISATREVSQNRHSRPACSRIMAGVLSAQALLALLGLAIATTVSFFLPVLHDHPLLLGAGLLYAVAQGFMPLWFFQGLEQLGLAAALEVTGKLLALGALFVFVCHPQDAWKVVAIQACASLLSTLAGLVLAIRLFSWHTPDYVLLVSALRRGWPMFVFRSAESLYGVGNAFILGLFAPPSVVGYFAVAEKISKAVFGLLNPIRDALFPRLSHLVVTEPLRAARLARRGVAMMSAVGLVLSGTLYVAAPLLIHALAGRGFERAVTVLRILSPLPVVLSLTYSAGMQWLLPLGRDAAVNRIILVGGAINVTVAFLVAPRFAEVGMAASVLAAELLVCIGMVFTVISSTDLWKLHTKPKLATLEAMPGRSES